MTEEEKRQTEELLTTIENLTQKYQNCFPKTDLDYIDEYCQVGRDLNERDELDKQRHSPWSRFNFRHGLQSIKGFHAEVVAIIIWNSKGFSSRLYLCASDERDQRAGIDLTVYNPQWSRPFNIQVKSLYHRPNHVLVYHPDFFQYDPQVIDRLFLINPDRKKMMCLPYNQFRTTFDYRASQCDKGQALAIPTAELRQFKHFTQLSL